MESYLLQRLPDTEIFIASFANIVNISLTTAEYDPFVNGRHFEDAV
jgi:hypothetical protein